MPSPNKPAARFMTIEQVAEELSVGIPQVRSLLKSGELRGLQIGARRYLAHLLGLKKILPGIAGEERRKPREVSVWFVRIVGRRCASVAT
jgi:excisionase family DNA binding protein